MTSHERWTVYPLLLLTLGMVMRDKITRTLSDVRAISGEQLQLNFAEGVLKTRAAALDSLRSRQAVVDEVRCRRLIAEQVQCQQLAPVRGGTVRAKAELLSQGLTIADADGNALILAQGEDVSVDGRAATQGTITTLSSDGRQQSRIGQRVQTGALLVGRPGEPPWVVVDGWPLPEPEDEASGGEEAEPAQMVGRISVAGADGQPVGQLAASDEGGLLNLLHTGREFAVTIEHLDEGSGMLVRTAAKRSIPLVVVPQARLRELLEAAKSRATPDGEPPEPEEKPAGKVR